MAIGNLENLQEREVMRVIREIVESGEEFNGKPVCTCNECLVDMTAIALNMLPPHYVADKYYKFPDSPDEEKQRKEQVSRAVRMAMKRVVDHPHH